MRPLVILGVIFEVVGLGLMLSGIFFLSRVQKVYRERMRIIEVISQANRADIEADLEWEWRYVAFNAGPTFRDMVRQFWKPVDSFFPDRWDRAAPTGIDPCTS